MLTIQELLAVLMVERDNFQVLHWRVTGHHFDNMHNNVTNKYYEMVAGDIDDIAEIGMRMDIPPVDPCKAYEVARNVYANIPVHPAAQKYDRDSVIRHIDCDLSIILKSIRGVLESDEIQNKTENVGIKSFLEALYDKYDKEFRFLNKGRQTENEVNDTYEESTMEDSFIYKSFNASNALIEKLVKYLKTSVALDNTYIGEQYAQIRKTSISPLSKKVLDAYDNGELELLFSRDVKIGNSIPFIIRKNGEGKVVATIFIASFANIDKDDNLNIPVKQLYALMESAYVALQLQINPSKIQRNATIMKNCMNVYVEMMLRILNKEYALSLDNSLYDKCKYVISKFFLTTIWEYPNKELIEAYSTNDLKHIDQLDLELCKKSYNDSNIKDINDLLNYLRALSPRMKELNTRYYIEKYVNVYHGSSILSIDYLPYVFFVIINTILGSFLISMPALNDIIKSTKDINKFYPELSKII